VPWLTTLALAVVGLSLVYSIAKEPEIAVIAVVVGTFAIIVVMGIVSIVSLDARRRLSPLAEQPYYSYEVLSSTVKWEILSTDGSDAILRKNRRLRFLQDGVSVISEYVWGDESIGREFPLTNSIKVRPGRVLEVYREGAKYVITVDLRKPYGRGEVLDFYFERKLVNAFTRSSEWVEVQPVENIGEQTISVVLPAARSLVSARAKHRHGDYSIVYPPGEDGFKVEEGNGTLSLSWLIGNPVPRDSYFIEWDW
jgi:hypothetical protein